MKTKIFSMVLTCVLAVPALALQPGDQVPNFSAKNQDGKIVHLADYAGHNVLIYFYPKDETPGCTTEARQLRDQYADFKKANTIVLGISRQDEKSHQQFIKNEKIPFDLLIDPDGSVAKTLGVGTIPIVGLDKRQSLLVNTKGQLIRFYGDVDPAAHAKEVLTDVQKAVR